MQGPLIISTKIQATYIYLIVASCRLGKYFLHCRVHS